MRRRPFVEGVRDAFRLPAYIVGLSLLGVGSLVRDVGHPAGAALLSTALVWAGPSQVILYGSLAAGMALPAIAAAVTLASLRFLPMVVSVMPLLRRPGQGIAVQLLVAHYVAVTVWIESLRRLPDMPPEERLPWFFGFGSAVVAFSALTTYLGYYLVGVMPSSLAAGLLFLTPVFFTLSLVAGARQAADWLAIALGFALTPTMGFLVGRDFDLLATGLLGGTAAYGFGRLRRRRA
jgi:predicted branched-subunit amino acid permease